MEKGKQKKAINQDKELMRFGHTVTLGNINLD